MASRQIESIDGRKGGITIEKFARKPFVFEDPPNKKFLRFSAIGSLAIFIVLFAFISIRAINVGTIIVVTLIVIIPMATLPYAAVVVS
jgi:hypothetical protein